MKKLTKEETIVYRQYSKIKCNPIRTCKINQLNIDCQPKEKNHREHELAKFNIFYDHTEQGHNVLTES